LDHRAHRAVVDGDAAREQRRDVLAQAVSSTDEVRKGLRILVGRLRIINVGLRQQSRLGADGLDLLMSDPRVAVVIRHMVLRRVRSGEGRLRRGLGLYIVVSELLSWDLGELPLALLKTAERINSRRTHRWIGRSMGDAMPMSKLCEIFSSQQYPTDLSLGTSRALSSNLARKAGAGETWLRRTTGNSNPFGLDASIYGLLLLPVTSQSLILFKYVVISYVNSTCFVVVIASQIVWEVLKDNPKIVS
ncbi:hypothetical protein THAOC_06139, partial [Thalassiosira oceanica]